MQITGETKLIGFFGESYKNSKLFAVYNAVIARLGINYLYVPFVVDNLEKAIIGMRNLGISAIGITVPYKIDIIKYIDELDSNAKRIGAVNVVVNKNGRLIGGNTDGVGAVMALKEVTEINNKKVLLIGAGGAARALAYALKDEGLEITILNRTEDKAIELAKAVGCNSGSLGLLDVLIKDVDILINATSTGMKGAGAEDISLIPSKLLNENMTVMELVHKPKETVLIQEALKKGCDIVYGYRMLLWQAVKKFKLYTGIEPPIELMEKIMEKNK